MIRLILEILLVVAVVSLLMIDIDGQSFSQHVSNKGLKHTFIRVWDGPQQSKACSAELSTKKDKK